MLRSMQGVKDVSVSGEENPNTGHRGAAVGLRLFLEEVRAPGANRADVDALLRGLAQPPGPKESARERADVLLEILNDAQLRNLPDNDGRSVRAAALEALLALGFPYALEAPPDALTEGPAEDARLRPPSGRSLLVGAALLVAAALVEFYFVLAPDPSNFRRSDDDPTGPLMLIASTTLLPGLLAVLGARWRLPSLNGIATWALALLGALWLFIAFVVVGTASRVTEPLLLFLPVAHLLSAVCLSLRKLKD